MSAVTLYVEFKADRVFFRHCSLQQFILTENVVQKSALTLLIVYSLCTDEAGLYHRTSHYKLCFSHRICLNYVTYTIQVQQSF